MTCAKSKTTNGEHCRHGFSQICCWCGESAHGPFMPGTLSSYTGYTCATCGAHVFGNTFHYCAGQKHYTLYNGGNT